MWLRLIAILSVPVQQKFYFRTEDEKIFFEFMFNFFVHRSFAIKQSFNGY